MNQLKLQSQFCWWSEIWRIFSFNYLLQFWCLDLVSLLIFAKGLKDTFFLLNLLTEPFFWQRNQWLDSGKWVSSDWDQFLVVNLSLDCMVILGQYEIKRFEFYEFFRFFGFLVDPDKRLKWSDVKILLWRERGSCFCPLTTSCIFWIFRNRGASFSSLIT